MIRTARRSSLGIKPGWMSVPRSNLRWISNLSRRRRRKETIERKALGEARKLFPIPIPPAAPAVQGPDRNHDLLLAVAELAHLEQRIGYTFKDKLLGISAFKISAAPVKFKSMRVPLEDWKRLALLGDRVLYLALCQVWFESRCSRLQYELSVPRLTTRWTLAAEARRIHLDRNLMTKVKSNLLSHHVMGEVFEALLGAIYLDSESDVRTIQNVLRNIGFGEATPDKKISAIEQSKPQERLPSRSTSVMGDSDLVEKSSTPQPAPAKQMQTEPHLQSTAITDDITNAIDDYDTPLARVVKEGAKDTVSLNEASVRINPRMLTLYLDLAEVFRRNPIRVFLKKDRNESQFGIFDSMRNYLVTYTDVVDLCSWFPALQARYAWIHGVSLEDSPRDDRWVVKRRRRATLDGAFTTNEECPPGLERKVLRVLRQELRTVINTEHNIKLRHRTVIELVRRFTDGSESGSFLTALRIEERIRDRLRQDAGLPDWYDLPDNRHKILPPWRASQATFHSHAETVIPVDSPSTKEVFAQPPLLLDTPRQPVF